MKKYIYYLFGALLAVAFYSCTSEENAMDGNTGRRITVSFGLPEGAASTRVDETTEDTGAESALHQADLYCFDYTGGEKGVLKSVIHLTENQLLQNNPAIDLENGDYYIEAIANENHLDLEEGTSTYADYLELRATSEDYTRWSEVGFIMQGANTAHITNATTVLNINFTMVRLVARIDVVNRVDGLTITGAKMENSVKESFYVEDETSIIAKESGSKETRTKSGLSVPNGRSVQIFYTYEGSVEESGSQISFEGVDEDGIKYASLPIVEFKNQNNHPAFMRNKLYTVTLYEVDGAIKTEVTVTDWASQAIENEVTVEDGLEVTVNPDGSGITLKDDNKAVAGDVKTIYVPAEGAAFSVTSESSNIEVAVDVLSGSEWLTVTETRSLVQKFQVVVAKNTAETVRTGQFVVRNMLKPEVKVTYNVVQAGAEPKGPDWENDYPNKDFYGAASLEQWVDSYDATGENGKSFFMLGTPNPAVDTSSPLANFDTRNRTYWSSSDDPSKEGYRMASKTDWEALAWVVSNAGKNWLTLNGQHYKIVSVSKGNNQVKIQFYACNENQQVEGEMQTISFGGGGSIITNHESTSPWNTKSVSKTNVTRYWCAGNIAYYVDLSYNVAVMKVGSTSASRKGIDWYAMRIRSIKE